MQNLITRFDRSIQNGQTEDNFSLGFIHTEYSELAYLMLIYLSSKKLNDHSLFSNIGTIVDPYEFAQLFGINVKHIIRKVPILEEITDSTKRLYYPPLPQNELPVIQVGNEEYKIENVFEYILYKLTSSIKTKRVYTDRGKKTFEITNLVVIKNFKLILTPPTERHTNKVKQFKKNYEIKLSNDFTANLMRYYISLSNDDIKMLVKNKQRGLIPLYLSIKRHLDTNTSIETTVDFIARLAYIQSTESSYKKKKVKEYLTRLIKYSKLEFEFEFFKKDTEKYQYRIRIKPTTNFINKNKEENSQILLTFIKREIEENNITSQSEAMLVYHEIRKSLNLERTTDKNVLVFFNRHDLSFTKA